MSGKKRAGCSVRTGRGRRGGTPGSLGSSASLSAFQALLNADSWLLVASNVVNSIGKRSERDKLEELRRSVAARLEHLQQDAYNALSSDER
jgi:hypothetical protein